MKRKINNSEKYIKEKSTTKGTPNVMLSNQQKKTYDRHKKELPYYKNYVMRLESYLGVLKSMKSGQGLYTQKKRNAYNI